MAEADVPLWPAEWTPSSSPRETSAARSRGRRQRDTRAVMGGGVQEGDVGEFCGGVSSVRGGGGGEVSGRWLTGQPH